MPPKCARAEAHLFFSLWRGPEGPLFYPSMRSSALMRWLPAILLAFIALWFFVSFVVGLLRSPQVKRHGDVPVPFHVAGPGKALPAIYSNQRPRIADSNSKLAGANDSRSRTVNTGHSAPAMTPAAVSQGKC